MRLPTMLSLISALLLATAPARSFAQPSNDRICFPEAAPAIQNCIDDRFAQFWRENGGLVVFGYPISAARPESNSDTGQTYLTQYFERQRFEHHPESPRPYKEISPLRGGFFPFAGSAGVYHHDVWRRGGQQHLLLNMPRRSGLETDCHS